MQQEMTELSKGIFEDDSHSDNCLLRKVWRTLIVHEYNYNLSRLSE